MDPRSSITPWDLECMLCDETAEPKALPLSLLQEITNSFSNEHRIGSGGFAVVYKGILENRTVPVKRMSNTYLYEKEFQREVECLMMVKHKNVVGFLGYCADTQGSMEKYDGKFIMADVQQRLLCFEYLPKGSLHEYITDTSRGLRWRNHYQIIIGICQGLHYLRQKNILHLDLMPANILLDDSWVPKIIDFGMSRCSDQMQSQVLTNIAGTPGYLAPESFNHSEVTYRNSYRLDIYSLGVVIIEILTGKKGYQDVGEGTESWSYMLDEPQCEVQMEQVRLCAEIGIECTNFDPTKRPDTQNIISRLGEIKSLDGYINNVMSTSQQINPDILIGTTLTLWLSYQQLNPDIRRCLQYCSIFPRGSKLRRNQLVGLWIAQSLVKIGCETDDMEDVAEGYIRELVSYSFLQIEETRDGEGCFTIDSVLHTLLDKAARNCFRIENGKGWWVGEEWRRGGQWRGHVPRDVQHLLIKHYDARLITEKILRLTNLLTLIVYVVEGQTEIEEKVIKSICKSLPKLQVLAIAFSMEHDLVRHHFSVPKSIKHLKNLCYLGFRLHFCYNLVLPSTLNELHHIQFLDFGDSSIVKFNFADLINLRHIVCLSGIFSNIGRLISLKTMPTFELRNEQGYELKQLSSLNKLRGALEIRCLQHVESKEEALEANLAAKEELTELTLKWNIYISRCISEVEAEVLEGLCPPVGLQTLGIYNYKGSSYPDWMVGKQNGGPKDLRQLWLWQWSQMGPAPQLVQAFPHLLVLQILFCTWDALPGTLKHLTSLQCLVIDGCQNIRSLPTLPQSLMEFHLKGGNTKFMKSCLIVGDPNWQKIEHIPKKTIEGLSTVARMQAKIWSCTNHSICF